MYRIRFRLPARRGGHVEGLVVSLTSFPGRAESAWLAIESIFRQTTPPEDVVLVLTREEFGTGELPRSLRRLERRGLTVLWQEYNYGCFNKLIPVRSAYPGRPIITVDDDCIYAPWMVQELIRYERMNPGTVVGHRGWSVMRRADGGLAPYVSWPKASERTPSGEMLLTGVGGVLYPADLPGSELLNDLELAMKLTPDNDDIWYWAVERARAVTTHCVGRSSFFRLPAEKRIRELSSINRRGGYGDVQLARVVEYFGLDP